MAFRDISPSKKNAPRSSVTMTNGNLIQLSQFRSVYLLTYHMMVFKTCAESVFSVMVKLLQIFMQTPTKRRMSTKHNTHFFLLDFFISQRFASMTTAKRCLGA